MATVIVQGLAQTLLSVFKEFGEYQITTKIIIFIIFFERVIRGDEFMEYKITKKNNIYNFRWRVMQGDKGEMTVFFLFRLLPTLSSSAKSTTSTISSSASAAAAAAMQRMRICRSYAILVLDATRAMSLDVIRSLSNSCFSAMTLLAAPFAFF